MLDTNWRGDDALDSQCTDEKTRLRKNERTKICVNETEPDKKCVYEKMNRREYAWTKEELDKKMRLDTEKWTNENMHERKNHHTKKNVYEK